MGPGVCFEFTAIRKCLSANFTLIWLITPVTALMSIESSLPSECLPANRASKVFIVAMRQEMTLEFGLLGEWLVGPVTSFPATVVAVTSGAVNSVHMSRNKMILKSTRICESYSARCLNSVDVDYPLAGVKFIILGREIRSCQDRRNASVQRWRGFSRA